MEITLAKIEPGVGNSNCLKLCGKHSIHHEGEKQGLLSLKARSLPVGPSLDLLSTTTVRAMWPHPEWIVGIPDKGSRPRRVRAAPLLGIQHVPLVAENPPERRELTVDHAPLEIIPGT